MAFISHYDSILQDDEKNEENVENIELEYNVGDELFLDLLQQKSFLYDKTDKNHHDRLMVNNAWSDISNVMCENIKQCQSRWERLKKYYNREKMLRQKESKSGSGQSKRKPWKLFERVNSIFNKVAVNRSTVSNLNTSDTYREADTKPSPPTNCISGNKSRTKPKKDTYGISATMNNLNSVMMTMVDVVQNKADSKDIFTSSDKIFGELISSELCHFDDIDPDEALRKYKEIMNYLSDV